jgi:integrase
MNFVQPIRNKEKIENMKAELKRNGTRDYLLFVFGINVGLRISDIIELKVKDVMDYNGRMRTHIEIKEKKTEKMKRFKLNASVSEELYQFIKNKNMEDYIFKSRNGDNQPITRVRAYVILNEAGKKCRS